MRNKTWSLVPLPAERIPIGCKWVYKVNENQDGTINKYNEWLVAEGFHQKLGWNHMETFSPIVKPVAIQEVLAYAILWGWTIHQLNVNIAFSNGRLQEVYMSQPQGFESSDETLACKLHKALYGLQQAPKAWFEKLTVTLYAPWFSISKEQFLFIYLTLQG